MPKLWNDTIEAHRHHVRETICEVTAALVEQHGLRAVTMAQVAESTGIGRATLYKYFPDVDSILHAWHARHIAEHLAELSEASNTADDPRARLDAVLTTFALIAFRTKNAHSDEVVQLLHRDADVAQAQQHLRSLVAALITDAVNVSIIVSGMDVDELTTYCLHAVSGAAALDSEAAVGRLVRVTLAGLTAPN